MEIKDFAFSWTPYDIVKFPDPRLKAVAKPVTKFDAQLKEVVYRMLTTMYAEPGCGLAANQVGLGHRIFVADVDYNLDAETGEKKYTNLKPQVFINPVIVNKTGKQICEEGCLSFPGITVKVQRFQTIAVKYVGLDGEPHEVSANEFFSNCIQHEYDHLEGITFLDRLSPLKREIATAKYVKGLKEKKL